MKRFFLILILILFYSSPTFSDANFKGIICECIKCNKNNKSAKYLKNYDYKVKGYILESKHKSNVYEWFFGFSDDTVWKFSNNYSKYSSSEDFIYWSTNQILYGEKEFLDIRFKLNRKNLKLTIEHIKPKKNTEVRQCFRVQSNQIWMDKLKEIEKSYQNEVNKRLKGNKI